MWKIVAARTTGSGTCTNTVNYQPKKGGGASLLFTTAGPAATRPAIRILLPPLSLQSVLVPELGPLAVATAMSSGISSGDGSQEARLFFRYV